MVLVVHPRVGGITTTTVGRRCVEGLTAAADVHAILETRGDGEDVVRIETLLREQRPDVVVAAGGDGTVNEVAQALLTVKVVDGPSLAIIPLGTGNNVARSLGLKSCRKGDPSALDLAVRTAVSGGDRQIDAGEVNGQCFLGSFALGMDADILHTRNRVRDKLHLHGAWAGYALYLGSCAVNLCLAHGSAARLNVDGAQEDMSLYGLVVTKAPTYAGEFRFAAEHSFDDGRLQMVAQEKVGSYLRGYVAAWPRHLRHQRGRVVRPDAHLRPVRRLTVELARPLRCQLDGEEIGPSDRYEVRVLPRVVTMRVPA